MLKLVKVGFTISLFSFVSVCYAIRVDVQSNSEGVYAVGFVVNGNQYGGPGKSFSQDNLPAGVYTFGIRVGGLIIDAEDITCASPYHTETSVILNTNTKATLMYDGNKRCYLDIQPA